MSCICEGKRKIVPHSVKLSITRRCGGWIYCVASILKTSACGKNYLFYMNSEGSLFYSESPSLNLTLKQSNPVYVLTHNFPLEYFLKLSSY